MNPHTGRCQVCEQQVAVALNRFRQAFLGFCADGVLTAQEWHALANGVAQDTIAMPEALAFVQNDAFFFVMRTLTHMAADGVVTEEEVAHVRFLEGQLQLPAHLREPIDRQLLHHEFLVRVRKGDLPTVRAPRGVILEAGEICHFVSPTRYERVGGRKLDSEEGTLVLTARQFVFMSKAAPHTVSWSSVMQAEQQPGGVFVQSTKKTGTGLYRLDHTDVACAVIETIAKMQKRQLVKDKPSRSIPQKIRNEVFQKFGGKCGECRSAEWLEYDHVIPLALGGANSLENLQLLCRGCNQRKSDRI